MSLRNFHFDFCPTNNLTSRIFELDITDGDDPFNDRNKFSKFWFDEGGVSGFIYDGVPYEPDTKCNEFVKASITEEEIAGCMKFIRDDYGYYRLSDTDEDITYFAWYPDGNEFYRCIGDSTITETYINGVWVSFYDDK